MTQKPLYFTAVVFAFCSLVYELLFALAISISLGGTNANYILAIGVFLFGLGIGSLVDPKRFADRKFLVFAKIEIALCLVFLVGFYVVLLSPFVFDHYQVTQLQLPLRILSGLFCFVVGLLSGTEIPFLLAFADSKHSGKIIAFDYWGSFLASLLFSLWLIPILGVLLVANLVPLLNLLGLSLLLRVQPHSVPWPLKLILGLMIAFVTLLVAVSGKIEMALSSLFGVL